MNLANWVECIVIVNTIVVNVILSQFSRSCTEKSQKNTKKCSGLPFSKADFDFIQSTREEGKFTFGQHHFEHNENLRVVFNLQVFW